MSPDRQSDISVSRLLWDSVAIEISYEPDWSGLSELGWDRQVAHLSLTSIDPERAPLPVTETGYRSHFLSPTEIAAEVVFAMGVVALVERRECSH